MGQIYKFKIFIILFSIFACCNIEAQEFKWLSNLPVVHYEGYYKVQLVPEIVSKLNSNLSDIRIFDDEENEIPYIVENEKSFEYKDYFVEYKIIEKTEQSSWPFFTRLVIHNPKKNDISNIHLLIRNSDVRKTLKLSGSDDNKNWYSIKDGYRFHSLYSDENSSVIKIIDFPVSNYEYYEILIDDWKNNPLNIVKAGYFNTSIENGKYTRTAFPEISQLELSKENQSLVKIVFNENIRINKIILHVKGPEFYYREAEFQIRDSILNKRNQYEYNFRTLSTVIISSNTLNSWYFDNLRDNNLYLRINNFDDAPLKIDSAVTEQLNSYLICKMDKKKNYKLKFGNDNISQAIYDLEYFKDKIPTQIPVIQSGEIKSLIDENTESKSKFVFDKRLIWAFIIIVAVFLIYMITKMLKEMKAHKGTDNIIH
jgi:hypothetical protein